MRTLEYLVVTAVVAFGAWLMVTATTDAIKASLERSAATIESASK